MESQELIVNPANKGFKDLHITPISFGAKAGELVDEIYWLYNTHEVTKRDAANNWGGTYVFFKSIKSTQTKNDKEVATRKVLETRILIIISWRHKMDR